MKKSKFRELVRKRQELAEQLSKIDLEIALNPVEREWQIPEGQMIQVSDDKSLCNLRNFASYSTACGIKARYGDQDVSVYWKYYQLPEAVPIRHDEPNLGINPLEDDPEREVLRFFEGGRNWGVASPASAVMWESPCWFIILPKVEDLK